MESPTHTPPYIRLLLACSIAMITGSAFTAAVALIQLAEKGSSLGPWLQVISSPFVWAMGLYFLLHAINRAKRHALAGAIARTPQGA